MHQKVLLITRGLVCMINFGMQQFHCIVDDMNLMKLEALVSMLGAIGI